MPATKENVNIRDGEGNPIDSIDDSGARRLQVDAKIAAGGASQDVHPVDTNDVDLDVAEDVAIPANTRGIVIAGYDLGGTTRFPTVSVDQLDAKRRMEISGKVTLSSPVAPPTATEQTFAADTPLNVTTSETDDFILTNATTFTLTQVVAGAEGDPNERGSKVEIFYVDSGSTEHIVSRFYLVGFTEQIFPDTDTARDGTLMVGDGVTTAIRIVRERLGGSGAEIDVVARGFEI